MAVVMEVVQAAQMILSAAQKVYEIVDEVNHFKHRSRRLMKRIKHLMPIVENLASSEQKVPDSARTPEGLKIFSEPLGELRQLIQRIGDFIESLQEKSFVYKVRHKNEIGKRFDEYSEELDCLRNTVHFALTVEAREVTYSGRGLRNTTQFGMAVESREVTYNSGRVVEDRNDQTQDERSLLLEYEKGQKEILEEMKKENNGQEEIMKILQEIKSKLANLNGNGQGSINKRHSAMEGLQEIDRSQLTDKTFKASGRFGKTFYAKYMHEHVAVKYYSSGINGDVKENLIQEAKTLRLLNSTYIVRLWGVCTETVPYLLVFEYMARGKLREVLDTFGENKEVLPWERRMKMSLDGALGLYRMHNTRPSLLHQDLASDNFLVDENWRMKLTGVGLAKTQTSILKKSKQVWPGRQTLSYICPERLQDFNIPPSASTDVYSYGIVMWEIATGLEPYKGLSDEGTAKFVRDEKKKLELPSDCPSGFATLIDNCREFDPVERPTSSDIVTRLQNL